MGGKNILIAAVVVALLVAVYFALQERGPVAPEEPEVLQGRVEAIDEEARVLTLFVSTLLQEGEVFSVTEETFTVRWNDDTIFYVYDNVHALESGRVTLASEAVLEVNKNGEIIVASRSGNSVLAGEVRILPGSASAEVVEEN